MPEHVFLVRHGQTLWNTEHRLQGQLDSPLTADGRAQAESVARRLAAEPIETVCTSPRGRARTTAEIIADRLGATVVEIPELADVHHGVLAGLTWDEVDERYPSARRERAENRYGWAFPGGESYAQARSRARTALSACGWQSNGVPVLVTHEMIGRMLRAELRGLNAEHALALRHPHGTVLEIVGGAERML